VFLEDIIVSNQYRRFGVGTKLFDAVVKKCKELGVRKMDWQILDWNEPAINFYKKYNTVFSDEWLNGSLYEQQLKELNV
jgi:ribosomal protein S18 acetylase RimI-like enzyme